MEKETQAASLAAVEIKTRKERKMSDIFMPF